MAKRSSKTDISRRIEVRPSEVHGRGVFALQALPRGSVVGIYEGRRYSEAEALRMDWDDALTYLFGLSDGTLIDGSEGGNATRHLNHACSPNCEAVEYNDDSGNLGLRIETIRAVRPGEELTIDYALQVDPSSQDTHACACGSAEVPGHDAGRRPGSSVSSGSWFRVEPPQLSARRAMDLWSILLTLRRARSQRVPRGLAD